MNNVEYLILSSTIDYSTDLICYELNNLKKKYLRINRDNFNEYKIVYSLDNESMMIDFDNEQYFLSNNQLKGIYYRAPVFLRSHKHYGVDEQLSRSQWSAFLRNLIVFNNANWVNHPVDTYRAENKIFQLKTAKESGLLIPESYVGNNLPDNIDIKKNYIVKSLDTALFYDGEQELFTYSSVLSGKQLTESNIQNAPIIIQECLEKKIDLRVTYVDGWLFPVSITKQGVGIEGDWRKNKKDELIYNKIDLPNDISEKTQKLMKKLNLRFGGLDFALVDGRYYFIEVNPTGEWAWIVGATGMPIDKKIAETLIL